MAGTVTSLTFQKRNPDRVSVYLDGKFAFGLAALDAASLKRGQFLSDEEISDLKYLGLRAKAYDRALRFLAVRPRSTLEVRQNLQRYRPQKKRGRSQYGQKADKRSRGSQRSDSEREPGISLDVENEPAERAAETVDESADRAQQAELAAGLPQDLIDWVLHKLTDQGYLDDEAFARFWIEQRGQFKPMAPRAIRYELRGKGIDPNMIERLLSQEVDPESAALDAARTRSQRWQHLEYEEFRHKMAGFLQRRGFSWSTAEQAIETAWQETQS